jgi:hypothetical protein
LGRAIGVLPGGQADLADALAEGVVRVDRQLRPAQAGVREQGADDQSRHQLHRLVIRRADLLADDQVEATPERDERKARVHHGPHGFPECLDRRAVVGAGRGRLGDEVKRAAHHAVDDTANRRRDALEQ